MITPQRFARGMTFDEYVRFIGSAENLAREGFDVRRGALVTPRLDWSGYFRARYAKVRLTDAQVAAIKWLAARPGGPAKILVLAEDWSSDCRRDVPYLARLSEAGGLEMRIFTRDGDRMHRQGLPDPAAESNSDLVIHFANDKNGQKFATMPVACIYTTDFIEIYRYVEYPAIYHKERLFGNFRTARAGESPEQVKERAAQDIGVLFDSPFFDVWAGAGIDEILSALHERLA